MVDKDNKLRVDKLRVDKLRAAMAAMGLAGFLVARPENRIYLSGFTGSNALLLITAAEALLLTDFRYVEQAKEQAPDFQVIRPQSLQEDGLVAEVQSRGLKSLGFEEDYLTFKDHQDYLHKLPDTALRPTGGLVEKIRGIKDDKEIALLRQAVHIADLAFDHILDFIQPGVRENDLALELDYFMRRIGAEKSAFDIIVASGKRSALPHGVASDKAITKGELITMDFGAVYQGYHSDITRTIILGKADRQQKQIYQLVLEAQRQAIEAVKPGVVAGTVDTVARDLIARDGYGANFGHGLGHSVGLAIHEKPTFSTKDATVLEKGMTLTVEPGIYLPGWGGVRIEDIVAVTAGGCEILTKAPKKLIEL